MTAIRVAIINRGEPAMRFINAVDELNREGGSVYTTIAVYTEPDRRAWFVRAADESVCLGPATVPDPDTGRERHSYLDYERLEYALVAARADMAWVGWGFVAEHAAFAELCDKLGVVFVGPPADVISRLGDKVQAKLLAEQAGVPVVPWSGGLVGGVAGATVVADRIGYPLLVKAAAGGGGRGSAGSPVRTSSRPRTRPRGPRRNSPSATRPCSSNAS
ncbi:hypothetical protein GCM10029964_056600 [Kibdelosporangium lantanae]